LETAHEALKQAEKDRTKAREGTSVSWWPEAEGFWRRWKLQPRVRSDRWRRTSRNQLPQRNSHEVSSCPFKIDQSNPQVSIATVIASW